MAHWFSRLTGSPQHNSLLSTRSAESDVIPFQIECNGGLISSPERWSVVRQLKHSINLQLDLLLNALNAASVVLLWVGPSPGLLSTYAFSSRNGAILNGPFPAGAGVFGVLKDRHEVALAPYRKSSPAIPYYSPTETAGSFFALCLFDEAGDAGQAVKKAILCIDRHQQDQWSTVERAMIAGSAEQLQSSLSLARDLLFADFERQTLQQAFAGLQTLNSALNMESVYDAAVKALSLIVSADVFAISLLDGENHNLCHVYGQGAERITRRKFALADSIVGQVVKYRRSLPENSYSRRAPVINGLTFFNSFDSLLVVPLLQEERPVIGVLIVAAQREGLFFPHCRELIEMIAAQVAIKIELAHSHEQINQMTLTDPLTGIANRRAFERGFNAMHERALRRSGAFSLLLCDIDHFKQVNDVYGHPFGDQVIQLVAAQLNDVVRAGDLAARIGGEEFAVLLEDTGRAGALEVAERLRNKVERLQPVFKGKAVQVTISLGFSEFPRDTDDREKLFNRADQALYCAKEKGRNRSISWNNVTDAR